MPQQYREWLDLTLLTLTVSQLLRNVNLPNRTCWHVNQSISPTLDNLVSTEIYGLTTLERRIEYLAVDCLTLVVNLMLNFTPSFT